MVIPQLHGWCAIFLSVNRWDTCCETPQECVRGLDRTVLDWRISTHVLAYRMGSDSPTNNSAGQKRMVGTWHILWSLGMEKVKKKIGACGGRDSRATRQASPRGTETSPRDNEARDKATRRERERGKTPRGRAEAQANNTSTSRQTAHQRERSPAREKEHQRQTGSTIGLHSSFERFIR